MKEIIFHPGEILKEELEEREISQVAFSRKNNINSVTINQIINCNRSITFNTAVRLEKALNIKAEYWLTMQMNWDLNNYRNEQSKLQANISQ